MTIEEEILNMIHRWCVYNCIIEVVVTPTYIMVRDVGSRFEIIIHSNKNLIKVRDGQVYKSEYSYIDLLYQIDLIDNVNMFFYPKLLKDEVSMDLQIHHRNKTIESLLI